MRSKSIFPIVEFHTDEPQAVAGSLLQDGALLRGTWGEVSATLFLVASQEKLDSTGKIRQSIFPILYTDASAHACLAGRTEISGSQPS